MSLFNQEQMSLLLSNGKKENYIKDHLPVVKVFAPDSTAIWLFTKIDPENPDYVYGLCDWGAGFPLLMSISINELEQLRGKFGQRVEVDRYFKAKFTISVYYEKAMQAGEIVP